MRAIGATAALAVLLATSGCFQFDVSPKINLGGSGGGGSGKTGGGSNPSQLPSSGGGSWRDLVTDVVGQTFVGAEHGAVFYAFDTLAYPNQPVDLTVKLLSARDLKAIGGVTVGFYRDEYLAGRVTTGADGVANLRWTPPGRGTYTFHARIVAVPDESFGELIQVAPAPLIVSAQSKDTPFAVVDLDHTVVDSSFFRVLLDGGRPMASSVEVLGRIAQQYAIIYLTHRPDLLTRKSKQWLIANNYPRGPLLVSEMKDVLDSGEFKTAKLSEVRKAFPGVALGIGDKLSDAQAYVDNGLTAYLIPHYDDDPDDMRDMARDIRRLRGQGRLQVVAGWREIEQGLFARRQHTPQAFATWLDREADRLEREKRRRDDDDDD